MATTRRRIKQSILTKDVIQPIEQESLAISESHWRDFTGMIKQQENWSTGMNAQEDKLNDIAKEIRQILIDKASIGAVKKSQAPTKRKRLGKG